MDECIFCKVAKGLAPSWKVMENEHAYAFLDINPVNKYHTLVIPKNHAANIFDISEQDMSEVSKLIRQVCNLYKEKLGINNLQIVCSNGREAQQDVFHIHFHIVPRMLGDGQSIRWKTFPEWRENFEEWLSFLKS